MKISRILISSVSVFTLLMLSGCEDKGTTEVKEVSKEVAKDIKNEASKQGNIDMHGGKESASMQESAMAVGGTHSGTVIEVIDADPYTYANVKTKNGDIWVAVPRSDIKKDIEISFNENMRVVDFESKTLGKTFDVLIFANEIQSDTPIKQIKPEHPHKQPEHSHEKIETPAVVPATKTVDANKSETLTKAVVPAEIKKEITQDVKTDVKTQDANKSETVAKAVAPAEIKKEITQDVNKSKTPVTPATDTTTNGAITIAEVYAKKSELNGKTIEVTGKVTKVSKAIMGKNWIHIQDGTGDEGSNDLIFTSPTALVEIGDEVTAKGVVAIDQDLGYGYFYTVIIQESTFSKK